MGKKLGGHTGRPADPNWPKVYSILCNIMISHKTVVEDERVGGSDLQDGCCLELGTCLLVGGGE